MEAKYLLFKGLPFCQGGLSVAEWQGLGRPHDVHRNKRGGLLAQTLQQRAYSPECLVERLGRRHRQLEKGLASALIALHHRRGQPGGTGTVCLPAGGARLGRAGELR